MTYCKGCRESGAPCASGGRGANGARCPEHENAAMTAAGALALDIAFSPGVALRAGMAGVVVGVDYRAALAIAPHGLDREAFKALLLQAEAGMLAGYAKVQSESR